MKTKITLLLALVLSSLFISGQTIMNIHQSNGGMLQLPINTIDSITYTISNPGDLATLTTLPITNITPVGATSGGNITNDGGSTITSRGIVWGPSSNPTTLDNSSINGGGTGNFVSNLSGLTGGTTYYVRAFAINSVGTSYGNEVSFTTTSTLQNGNGLTDVDGNTYQSVIIGTQEWMSENLNTSKYNDGSPITNVTDKNYWSDSYYDENGSYCYYNNDKYTYESSFGALYNLRAVETGKLCPTGWRIPLESDWNILTGKLSADGNFATEGKVLKSTSGWNNNGNGTDLYGFNAAPGGYRDNVGDFADAGYRAFWWVFDEPCYHLLYNSDDITKYYTYNKSFGMSVRCIKVIPKASVTTNNVTSITSNTAIVGGNITNDGGGTITSRGICWGTSSNPTTADNSSVNGSGTGSFTSNLSGLTSSTTYYVRAYAINSAGTSYGNEVSFTTTSTSSSVEYGVGATDVDGNTYKSVIIGEQEWFAENLRTTKYSDETTIPNVTGNTEWANDTTGAWCNYDNDSQYDSTYGKLYNWYAVETGKLCPTGWHVSTHGEWTVLTDYLVGDGHSGAEGKALKATSGWNSGGNGTDDYGFLGLPGGFRGSYGGFFYNFGSNGDWWSSSQDNAVNAWNRYLSNYNEVVDRGNVNKKNGFSVRCLRD